jgi:hypothetical protein
MAEFVNWDARVNLLPQLTAGQWTTITLSPPAGATVAMLRFIGATVQNQSKAGTCRRIGDTTVTSEDWRLGYYLASSYTPSAHASIHYAELTANQVEVYYSGAVDEVYVIGWLSAADLQMFDGVAAQDYIVEAPVLDTWLTLDLTAIPGASTASAALVGATSVSGSPAAVLFRTDPAGTNRELTTDANHMMLAPVPLVNGVCQISISGDLARRIVIRGLFGDGFVAPALASLFSPASGAAWFDYTADDAPEDATGVLYHHRSTSGRAVRIQEPGQDEDDWRGFDLYAGGHVFPVSGRSIRAFSSHPSPQITVTGWFRPTSPVVVVDDVNGNNIIERNGPIAINGQFPGSAATASLGGHPLTVTNVTQSVITCAPLDVFASPLPFGPHTLTVDATAEQGAASVAVELVVDTDHQAVTLTSVTPPLLAEGLSADVGDQLACPMTVSSSSLLLTSDGDVVYSPAVADGRSHTRYWYDASSTVWDSGLVTINGGEAPGEPVISAWTAKVTELGEVTLTGRTDTARGTVYAIVDASPTQPTNEQVRDGLNAAGAPALGKGSAAVTTADLSVTITGLPSDTLLYGWLAQWV